MYTKKEEERWALVPLTPKLNNKKNMDQSQVYFVPNSLPLQNTVK